MGCGAAMLCKLGWGVVIWKALPVECQSLTPDRNHWMLLKFQTPTQTKHHMNPWGVFLFFLCLFGKTRKAPVDFSSYCQSTLSAEIKACQRPQSAALSLQNQNKPKNASPAGSIIMEFKSKRLKSEKLIINDLPWKCLSMKKLNKVYRSFWCNFLFII